MREINLAVPAARLESEAAAALTKAAHLQDLCGGKLVQIADERVAGIDPFGGYSALSERTHKGVQLPPQAPLAAARRHPHDFLLVSHTDELLVVRLGSEANDVQRREMLTGVGRLFERDGGLAFHHKSIKIFRQQNGNSLGESSNDAGFDIVNFVENAKRAVLKDRISVQY